MTEPSSSDPKSNLTSLKSSLSDLEDSLGPLIGEEGEGEDSLFDKLDQLSLMERAKMDILLSYTINDLVWIYMKMKGVNPDKHDVTAELDRIKTYYGKIKSIEEPETQRTRIDTKAAHRFVKSSIPRSQHLPPTSASQLASQQAQAAVQEQDESLKRVSKAGRFRFIEPQGDEKIIPGQDQDQDMDEDEDEEDDEEAGIEEGGEQGAEEFLRGVEEEMKG
ncbi:uncharacterized protein IL334_003220 [Kwoniella shivajii]|uniref:Exosome complex protein n=1 Tax=Kwoniella shivajii TaxID=564305 RepID=A0ABZ1D123_9TREE|nr:hypothetical protein IL334_003220 [Kwoniella shivajii]